MSDCYRKLKNNPYVFFRLVIAGLFIVSGFEKLIGPYQNFLFVIQNYRILPAFGEQWVALLFPWIEFFLGIFLALGLWFSWSLRGIAAILLAFMIVVGQALFRHLPIDDCGCFGSLISFPLHVTLILDTTLFLLALSVYIHRQQAQCWSLDNYFKKNS